MNLTPEQQQELWDFMQNLKNTTTIPFEVDGAFRARFADSLGLIASSKSATSENETVDEAGASTYAVLTKPDLFLEVRIGTSTYYIPAYT